MKLYKTTLTVFPARGGYTIEHNMHELGAEPVNCFPVRTINTHIFHTEEEAIEAAKVLAQALYDGLGDHVEVRKTVVVHETGPREHDNQRASDTKTKDGV